MRPKRARCWPPRGAIRTSSASSCRRRARYRIDRALQRLLGERYVGDILSVEVQMLQRGFASFDGELDWRHDPEFSGINVLNVGGTYESAMRWLGPGNRVMAKTRVHIPTRRDARRPAARGDDSRSRRGALRARQRRAGAHEVQRDDGALARQPDLDLRQRRHDPRRQRAARSSRAAAAIKRSPSSRTRASSRRRIASRKNSSTRSAAASRSR